MAHEEIVASLKSRIFQLEDEVWIYDKSIYYYEIYIFIYYSVFPYNLREVLPRQAIYEKRIAFSKAG